eukprot:jgi/Mesvir1/16236/Mv08489-RA.1
MGIHDTSAEDFLEAILSAGNFFARLSLPVAPVERSDVRKAYRALALKCHPDKCEDARATDAFQRLSEAFETLYDEELQLGHLQSLAAQTDASRDSRKKARTDGSHAGPHYYSAGDVPTPTSFSGRGHRCGQRPAQQRQGSSRKGDHRQKRPQWWQHRSWAEVERELHRREEEEAALRASFVRAQSQGYSVRQQRAQMQRAQKVLQELDLRRGVQASRLWARCEDEVDEEAAFTAPPDATDASFEDVLSELREQHLYCFFCGAGFSSREEMDSYCPGVSEEDH